MSSWPGQVVLDSTQKLLHREKKEEKEASRPFKGFGVVSVRLWYCCLRCM